MAVNLARASLSTKPAAQDTAALKQVFLSISAHSCPLSYNFHMHTICSDGQLKPEELMEQAIAIGLKGLAITDHHSVGGYQVAQNWLNYYRQQLNPDADDQTPHLWTGVEINADLLGCEVHILGYAFDPELPCMEPYLQGQGAVDNQAANAIAAIQQAGGLAVLAHPSRYRVSAERLIPAAAELGIDGVETYYAYNNPDPWQPSPKQTQLVENLSATYGLLNTCGTDTHGKHLLVRL